MNLIKSMEYGVKRRMQSLVIFFITWASAMVIAVVYTFLKMNLLLSIILLLLFVVIGYISACIILSNIPIKVVIDSKGICLLYSNVKVCGILRPYYVKVAKKHSLLDLEISDTKENKILIKWVDINEIRINDQWIKTRCSVRLRNGDEIYLLSSVDRQIIKSIKDFGGGLNNISLTGYT